MQVNTKPYGIVNIDDRQKIFFPAGILGFENLSDYVLLDAVQQPFYWLQSLHVKEIAFVLINPVIFRPDYTVEVPEEELQEIDLTQDDFRTNPDRQKTLIFAIVTIPQNHAKMTANLQGPIIINKKQRIGRQCITTNEKWKVRHFILKELKMIKDKVC